MMQCHACSRLEFSVAVWSVTELRQISITHHFAKPGDSEFIPEVQWFKVLAFKSQKKEFAVGDYMNRCCLRVQH